jgi:hypothetical protein
MPPGVWWLALKPFFLDPFSTDPNFMPQTDKTASPYPSSLRQPQFRWKTHPTFCLTARLEMESPPEQHAYVAALAPDRKSRTDSLVVVDVDPRSGLFGKV